MISHKHKFIYTRVPKTGSTSLAKLLNRNVPDVFRPLWLKINPSLSIYTKTNEHASLAHLKSCMSERDYNEYFKFGIVRNPWDKLVSMYHKHVKGGKRGSGENDSFEDWITNTWNRVSKKAEKQKKNRKKKYCPSKFGPQYDLVEGCDFIGRFENLQQDVYTICDKINLPRLELPRKNTSIHQHYTKYYNNKTREMVAELYAKDIEYFNYKFD